MNNIVLDASIIIKWFQKEREEQLEEAEILWKKQLNQDVSINIPSILFYELYNHLARNPKTDIASVIKLIRQSNLIEIELNEELILTTVALVRIYHISFYDATYVALAKSLHCELITADKKLVKAVNLPFVKLLR
ncbi:MAG: type II toxin-antitoxin system VapC family toxin [bacterium]|nr:type II toxin-antitoxin system VapC family toxin [bacterium]